MRSTRVQQGLAIALVVVVTLVAATVFALVRTNQSVDDAKADLASTEAQAGEARATLAGTGTELDTRRAELASLLNRLQQSDDYLGVRTDSRNQMAEAVDKTRSELFTLSGALRNNYATVFIQEKQAADLDSCITKANQALNVLSHGEKETGKALLAESNKGCQAVNEYLATKGVQPE